MKPLWTFLLIGGICGSLMASWVAPQGIAWYFDPPVDIGVNCRAATEWSMRNLQRAQLGGFAGGAFAFLAAGLYWQRRKKNIASGSVSNF